VHAMKGRVEVLLALVVVLVGACGAWGQKVQSPTMQDRVREQHSLVINIVRAINAAEASYKEKNGSYATWETFIGSGDFSSTGTKWAPESLPTVRHAMYSSGPEIVPGWKLRLNVAKNGQSYTVVLEDANDPKCHFAISSDERGVIRQGKSVDCQ